MDVEVEVEMEVDVHMQIRGPSTREAAAQTQSKMEIGERNGQNLGCCSETEAAAKMLPSTRDFVTCAARSLNNLLALGCHIKDDKTRDAACDALIRRRVVPGCLLLSSF